MGNSPVVHLHVHTEFCLDPATLVATADLNWKPVSDVVVGEELVGFDEELAGGKSRMKRTTVEATKMVERDCYRIYLADGTQIVASAEHGWVTTGTKGSLHYPGGPLSSKSNSRKWVYTKDLVPGESAIVLWAKPWQAVQPENQVTAGWLAGVADGEAWLSHGQLNFGQNPGPVLDKMYEACEELGYAVSSEYVQKSNCRTFWLAGYETALRFVAQCQPVRFRDRTDEIWVGRKAGGKLTKPVKVVKVEHLGVQWTSAIQTSTKTLVAEGFLSHNSMLDGAAKVDPLVQKAAEDGQPAIASTDHGNMYAVPEMAKACKKYGVKYAPGTELYMVDDRHVKTTKRKPKATEDDGGGEDEQGEKMYYHLTSFAYNNTGYQNLLQLASKAFLEGFYRKPRVDWELLQQHNEGIIATTGCLGGMVLQKLMRDDYAGGLQIASNLKDIFGPDNLFVEVQDHDIPEQHRTNPMLVKLAKDLGLGLVATNDSHYLHQHDAEAHDALLCQPAGTQVLRVVPQIRSGFPRGTSFPTQHEWVDIEEIRAGDKVVSWNGDNRRGSIRTSGSRVSQVASRMHYGNVATVKTESGKKSVYTSDHLTVARLDSNLTDGNHVVYMMRKGNSYRVGVTQYRRMRTKARPGGGMLGVLCRMTEQDADAVWILSAHQTEHEAREEEAWVSFSWNIPTWSFAHPAQGGIRTPYYENLWNRAGDLTLRASSCLSSYGRDIDYPFWDKESDKPTQRRPQVIRACNLMSGMLVCESDGTDGHTNDGSGAWVPITVSHSWFSGRVYSLDVEGDHTYIADGIVTHNCINTGSRVTDENRFKFHGDQHYFKTAAEMRELFADFPGACDNTLLIAERFEADISSPNFKLPKFQIPDGYDNAADYLSALVYRGAQKRWGELTQEITDRLSFELSVIEQMGFSDYFLIVWDLIRYARSQGVRPGPGRGSAAGCAVSYCLRITDLDPIKYDLLFERFLNPSRISMPDIDMDIDSRFRDEWIRYTREKYGNDRVCQIITFTGIGARSAVRDAARVLDKPYLLGDLICKQMPPVIMGRDTPLEDCFNPETKNQEGYKSAKKLREFVEDDEDAQKVIEIARGLEGLKRGDSIHAAAVVIADAPLTNYLPIQRKPVKGMEFDQTPIVTQYEMHAVEDLGLLKMDFLGLRNLDVISDTLDMIEKTTGEVVDIDNIPMDDGPTFALLQAARTTGVFQLESSGMREVLEALRPTNFEDIAALVALYRPGPMADNMHFDFAYRKNGEQAISYLHPDAEDILAPTYGLMIYQEEMMRIAQRFAGYSLAEADNLRKACGKKIRELMAAEREKFIEGAVKTGYGAEIGKKWFDLIEPFADYSFNKSHAYAYGYVSYQTAYLKANYPVQYMACLLSHVGDLERAAVYLNECRLMGISVRVPDINSSIATFVAADGSIPYGLTTIKGVGEGPVELIVKEREENGPFKSFADYCNRVPIKALNKNTTEALIRAGAFESLGYSRKGLSMVFEEVMGPILKRRKKEAKGQFDLFSSTEAVEEPMPDVPADEWGKAEKLEIERELLGLYVSDHPLRGVENMLANRTNCTLDEIKTKNQGERVVIGGLIASVERKFTKKNDLMAVITIEDLFSGIEVVIFPKTLPKFDRMLQEGNIVVAQGRIDIQGEKHKFLLENMSEIRIALDDAVPLHLDLNEDELGYAEDLKKAFAQYPGNSQVFIHIGEKILQLPAENNVELCPQLTAKINKILGRG